MHIFLLMLQIAVCSVRHNVNIEMTTVTISDWTIFLLMLQIAVCSVRHNVNIEMTTVTVSDWTVLYITRRMT